MQDKDEYHVPELVSHFATLQTISEEYDLSQLPVELVKEVIGKVDSTGDLYNLCLVSKQYNQWATPQLYRSVFLSNAEHIRRFSTHLARFPDLGRVVRELWMFLSTEMPPGNWGKESENEVEDESNENESEDESDGSWMPNDEDSIGSSSDDSDLEENFENMDIGSELDDVNVPVHNSYGGAALIFPRAEIPQMRPATIPSSSGPHTSFHAHNDMKAWPDFLYPIAAPASIVYAHACAILSACTSLESLYLPWFSPSFKISSSCLHALSPYTRLRELAIYRSSDLLYSGFSDPLHFRDSSNVRRLTILDTAFYTLPTDLPDIFPHLTHLRISLHIYDDMLSCLSRFKALTYLWFAPPEGDWNERADLENFFQDLQIQCPNIKRVRVDVPLGSYVSPQCIRMADWNLFKFVSIQKGDNNNIRCMWIFPSPKHPESVQYLYNSFTECLKYYWTLRLTGGGWDD